MFVTVKFKIHNRRQHSVKGLYGLNEMPCLCLCRTVEAEEMIGPHLQFRVRCMVPVFLEPLIRVAASLRGLDICEPDILSA